MYQYEGHVRSDQTGANGTPVLLTNAADEDAQASLQHVVLTYDPVDGRRFYVNGVATGDVDAQGGGTLADWDDTFALVLGNETSTNRQWEGVLRLVAIHNRALTPSQIEQNFDAGVGEKYFMLFNVSHLVTVPQAYVMLEASQLDSYGLQFTKPTFISLDPNASVANLSIEGIRIGVNGGQAHSGQAYDPLVANVRLELHGRRRRAHVGSRHGDGAGEGRRRTTCSSWRSRASAISSAPYPDPVVNPPAPPVDLPPESDIGLRTFDELNATLSQITGVPQTNTRVVGDLRPGQAGAAGGRQARHLRPVAADRPRAARDPVLQPDGGDTRAAHRLLRRHAESEQQRDFDLRYRRRRPIRVNRDLVIIGAADPGRRTPVSSGIRPPTT